MDLKNKKLIRTCDWIIAISLLMLISSRFFTLIYLRSIYQDTKADIEAVYTLYESNPIVRATLNLERIGILLQTMIVPSIVFATYFYFRYKVKHKRFNAEVLHWNTLFLFFLVLTNFIHDLAILLGKFL